MVSIIAAVAENGVIGADGAMPWRLSTDMKRFRRLTTGKPVVMGRKTYESIGKPLVDRLNVVVSRQDSFRPDGVAVRPSLAEALAFATDRAGEASEIVVIGGGQVYAAAMALADRLYITHVAVSPEGDVHFPVIDPSVWRETAREEVPAGERDSAATVFAVYERPGAAI
ncbi:dihydrofolate reductase [Bauldia litoralis]|uniref:Dihydrofolate reductase n=1 Tax=Bauldia litoralis TaxID=665467 RepID=A0A1G6D4S8_9HYPH|nr:dihydrofolate reductase [Bauldia litoralis]SDB40118.1 dihydrofolate reductase [Bauldia litoralis]